MSTRWNVGQIPDLEGKLFVVTGANSGLGFEIARALASNRATVLMACRNESKANAAIDKIRSEVATDAERVRFVKLDLADTASIRAAAAQITNDHHRLDALINNAGLMALDFQTTADGFEMQFGVNHLGHFLLTSELMPLLSRTPKSRVATMSSMGHRMGRMDWQNLNGERKYQRWPAYFQSKLANLLFTSELHRRLLAANSTTIAVTAHPGASSTDLGTEGSGLTNKAMSLFPFMAQSAATGALPMLRAVTAPDVRGGEFHGCRFVAVGSPVIEKPSGRARNAADARRLWERSEQLLGMSFALQ